MVSAYDFEVDGIYYNITDAEAKTVGVTYGDNKYSGDVVIPESVTYDGVCYSVTRIMMNYSDGGGYSSGDGAFGDCSELLSVVIPNSVADIDNWVFYGCSGLTSIVISEGVVNIANNAFQGCTALESIVVEEGNPIYDSRDNCNAIINTSTSTLISGCNNSVIPEGVTRISGGAFNGCLGLTEINIPSGVTEIETNTFSGSGLTGELVIPNSVTRIGSSAFSNCNNLESVIIGDGVECIENDAFNSCRNLKKVVLGSGVKKIEDQAFLNTALVEVTSRGQ